MGLGKTYSTKYLLDSNNSSGVAGQVLSTTSTGIDWVDANTVPGTGLWLANGNDIYNSNSGNVGIGTTGPAKKLTVATDTVNDGVYITTSGGTNVARIGTSSTATSGALALLAGGSTKVFVSAKANENSYFNGGGNVGIGNTGPLSILTVGSSVGESRAAIYGEAYGTANVFDQGIRGEGTSYGVLGVSTGAGVGVYGQSSTGIAGYFTSSSGYGLLVANGNVGIGMLTPTRKLVLDGLLGTASLEILKESDRIVYLGTGSGATGADDTLMLLYHDDVIKVNINTVGDSYFNGGDVGIGTTSPDAILETSKEVDGNQVGALLTNTRQAGTADSVSLNFGLGRTADGFIFNTPAIKFLKEQQWTGTGSTVDGALVFSTIQNEAVSERARITSTGHLQVSTGYFELTSQPTTKLWLSTNQVQLYAGNLLVFGGYNASNDSVVIGNESGDVNVTLAGGANDKVLYLEGSSGNVGIGTKTPLAKLDIQGTQGQLFSVTDDLSGSIFAVSDISGVPIFDVNSSGVSYFDGDVGIGTTSPGRKLTVTGNASGDANNLLLANENDTDGDSASIGFSMLSNNTYVKSGIFFKRTTTQGRGDLIFANNNEVNGNNVTLSDAKITIQPGGNVGIGTTSPLELLHLESTEPLIRLDDTNSGIHYIFGQDGDGFKFTTNNSSYGKYTFDSNVGIGATSPIRRLDVIDTINGAYGTSTQQFVARFFNKTNDSTVNSAFISLQCSSDNEGSNPVAAIGVVSEGTLSNNGACVISTRSGGGILERMRISSAGAIKFNAYGAGTLVTDASGNITVSSGGGAGGPFLPLAGGDMTGGIDIIGVAGGIGSAGPQINFYPATANDPIGAIRHDGTDFIITAAKGNSDLILESDDDIQILASGGDILINEYIVHNNDPDTKFGFTAANQFQVIAGGNTNLNVQGNGVDLSYAGSTRLNTQTGGVAITGELITTGDVGIGVTNPSYTLEVDGTMFSSGNFGNRNDSQTIGIQFEPGSTSSTTMAVYSDELKVYFKGPNTTRFEFEEDGTARKPGGGSWSSTSDERVKKDITNYTKGLAEILAIQPVNYKYNGKAGLPQEKQQVGVIAQDVQAAFPNAVETYKALFNEDDTEETELLAFNPSELTFTLINAVKELKAEIELLKQQINN